MSVIDKPSDAAMSDQGRNRQRVQVVGMDYVEASCGRGTITATPEITVHQRLVRFVQQPPDTRRHACEHANRQSEHRQQLP
ncbi:MAG: hypothetical protein WAL22_13305 [Solirubrobacteraceae bacterium]